MPNPRSIKDLDVRGIIGAFFDIDDTFSSDGKIAAEAYASIWDLKGAGKVVVPITGRPAGWCDHIARMWPVDAVVGENGAFYFMLKDGRMAKCYTADRAERIVYKKKLAHIREEVLREVPGAGIASDQDYREFDLAIDFCEDVKPLSGEEIDKIVAIFDKYGANTKISSIHINGWFGGYDKLTTAKKYVRGELGINLDLENKKFAFCGDSPNDEPMFEYFENSVGVANVLDFAGRLKSFPKYITAGRSGTGFVEFANRLIGRT